MKAVVTAKVTVFKKELPERPIQSSIASLFVEIEVPSGILMVKIAHAHLRSVGSLTFPICPMGTDRSRHQSH